MDHLRQIRFVIGPFFFLGSLLCAGVLDCRITLGMLHELSGGGAAVLIAIAGASIFPLGFLIGGITIFLGQIWFDACKFGALEFSVGDAARQGIWTTLNAGNPPANRKEDIYGGTTYELEMFTESVMRWVDRRWNAFHASANSCTGLVLALFVAPWLFDLGARQWGGYVGLTLMLVAVLSVMARRTWRQTMGMIEFQATRITDGRMPERAAPNTARRTG